MLPPTPIPPVPVRTNEPVEVEVAFVPVEIDNTPALVNRIFSALTTDNPVTWNEIAVGCDESVKLPSEINAIEPVDAAWNIEEPKPCTETEPI